MKILVVEDEPTSRSFLRATFQKFGYETVLANDGVEGWEIFRKQPISIVVSDWVMPGIDGLQLCQKIRSKPSSEYTYFILLTAKSGEKENYRIAMDAGVDDFLTKPLDKETIWMRLRVAERILDFSKQIKQLKSFLPICMYCKKIRNDQNYWQQLELYIHEQTGSVFSHGVCPDCYQTALEQMGIEEKK
ncbi:MAG: response regulator [Blastocatellia bacterium]|nr:response regulator [Blastocatellia bacterium]